MLYFKRKDGSSNATKNDAFRNGKKMNLTEDQLIKIAQDQLGMSPEDALLMLAIERGETDSDIIEEKE